jgi:nitroimidazol reductase NimA-like FMN-containing flavoprotein (pyridoxamine 5'-phosphate oxidase superfamily)
MIMIDPSMEDLAASEVLTYSECLALLGQASLGRVGVSVGALPVILPVFYALDDQSILLRTVAGTQLDAATRNAVVAFQADAYVPANSSGWSVMAQGVASRVSNPDELRRMSLVSMPSWPTDDGRANLVRIEIARLSGRRFPYLDGWTDS